MSNKLTPEQKLLAKELTVLQRKFVIELVKPKASQRQAYLKAGGKAKTQISQDSSATQIFSNLKVRAFYDSLINKTTSDSILSREEALEILTYSSRVSMTDIADFKLVQINENEPEKEPVMQTVWTMKDSCDIDPKIMACIKSVTMTKQGPKIELYDKQGAIKQLSTMQGWDAAKKTELTGKDGAALAIKADVSAPEVVEALGKLMDRL